VRIASYIVDGREAYGVVSGDGLITVSRKLGGLPTLRTVLEKGALDQVKKAAEGATPDAKISAVTFLPVITNPDKIVAAGVNYRSHAAETGREIPKAPSMFIRLINTLVGHEGRMVRPTVSTNFDFEGELAVIIGKPGRHVSEDRALDYVAGYTCFNDGSVRDYQKFSVTSGKNFPCTGPLGPWMTTADEIPDPTKLTLVTRLNGQEMQRTSTGEMIYSVRRIISFVSDFTTLTPGDIIATGTPEGVGHKRNPQVWMKAGDVIEIDISGIGTLRNTIVDEK
jgi:2-keto-4-pentenoate hydratase/2-oxohepta-3-ene-1,7-dioic acid hydratase in catechol pathway